MRHDPSRLILWLALLVPLLLMAFVLPRVGDLIAGAGAAPTPEVLGVLAGQLSSPSALPAASPAASPGASPSPSPGAPAASPVPAAVSPPPAPVSPTPVRGAVPAGASPAPTPWSEAAPDGAVRDFYALVSQRQFAPAPHLWSPSMIAAYPPAEYIDARFAQTQRLVVNSTQVTSVDDAAGTATVKVDVTEVTSASPNPRHLAGDWYLVRGGSGWLLDRPSFP